jgi:hypothetical protein
MREYGVFVSRYTPRYPSEYYSPLPLGFEITCRAVQNCLGLWKLGWYGNSMRYVLERRDADKISHLLPVNTQTNTIFS